MDSVFITDGNGDGDQQVVFVVVLHVLLRRLNMRVAVTYSTENTLKLRHSICFEKPDTSKNVFKAWGSGSEYCLARFAGCQNLCLPLCDSQLHFPCCLRIYTDTHVMRDFDQTFCV